MKTMSFQVDDETYILIEHALSAQAVHAGVSRISKSVFLRRLIHLALGDPRTPFDQGFIEGYRAGVMTALNKIGENLSKFSMDPQTILDLGFGAPGTAYDERAPRRDRGG